MHQGYTYESCHFVASVKLKDFIQNTLYLLISRRIVRLMSMRAKILTKPTAAIAGGLSALLLLSSL